MSTKTNFKRIALVAVAALGLGVLTSVAPASAATAPTAGEAVLATTASTTGDAVKSNTDLDLTRSLGLITATNGTVSGGSSESGAILSIAKLALTFGNTGGNNSAMVLTGGKVNSTTGGVVSNDITSVYVASGSYASASISPTGAAGTTMVVAVYTGANVSALTPTAGSLVGIFTLTVVASNASAVYSPTYSVVAVQPATAKGDALDVTPQTFDSLAAVSNGQKSTIAIALTDAYGVSLTSGIVAASATNGALIKFGTTGSEGYTAAASYDSTSAAALVYLTLVQAVANTAGSTTVTISHNGSVVGTKTISWTGDAATISVSADSDSIFAQTTNEAGGVVYIVKDAAGNAINWPGASVLLTGTTGSMASASLTAADMSAAAGYGLITMTVGASDIFGAGTYQIKTTNAAGATIKSAVTNATVSGDPYTFTAAWDKTSYTSGDIASLTITLKDSKGNLVADGTTLAALGASSILVNNAGLSLLSSSCGDASLIYGGKKVCKFAALNTPGAYAYSVGIATGSIQPATVGTVTIGNGAVSNADVLKAIVSLIASINKQIAALQKALLKKK